MRPAATPAQLANSPPKEEEEKQKTLVEAPPPSESLLSHTAASKVWEENMRHPDTSPENAWKPSKANPELPAPSRFFQEPEKDADVYQYGRRRAAFAGTSSPMDEADLTAAGRAMRRQKAQGAETPDAAKARPAST